ncbi:MAG: hypothetical protein LBQ59_00840 [Candidatus Peribacteria bacterium]|jgi:hypothetical protein|nr:hypothetical protein [Candidatus Peribacteria bacterium]
MIKFIKKFSGIKDSNLVFLAFKQEELSLLKDLKLEKKVLDRIKKAIDKKENIVLDFFI